MLSDIFISLGTLFVGAVQHLKSGKARKQLEEAQPKDRFFQEKALRQGDDFQKTEWAAEESLQSEERFRILALPPERGNPRALLAPKRLPGGELQSSQSALTRQQDWRKPEQSQHSQREAVEKNGQTLLALAALQRREALNLPREPNLLDPWPLSLFPWQILESYGSEERSLLRVIPTFSGFQDLELEVGLMSFLERHYPKSSRDRAIEVLDGIWDSRQSYGSSSIKSLFGQLRSQPMLVLRTALKGDEVTCRAAYWGLAAEESFDKIFVESFSVREILLESAKARAQAWPEERHKYLAAGICQTEEEVDREYGGDDAWNLALLEQEERLQQVGIEPRNSHHYKIGEADKQALRQALVVCHCLLVGLFADCHYLIYNNTPPKLPKLLPELLRGLENFPSVRGAVRQTIEGYRAVFQALKQDRPLLVPDLSLELARSLAALDLDWAREEIDYSLDAWLEARGLSGIEGDRWFESMESVLQVGDGDYIAGIEELCARIGDRQGMEQMQALAATLAGWKTEVVEKERQHRQRLHEAEHRTHPLEVQFADKTQLHCGNGIALELVALGAGSLMMGSPPGRGSSDEHPQHRVEVLPFLMGKYLVTQRQWLAVMGAYKQDPGWKGDELPIERVTWYDAKAFCQALSERTGREVRLPTEAEWEYACRAGSQTDYSFGDSDNRLGDYAWYDRNSNSRTHPVGQKQPNAWGLYDMHGNVWEWCEDHWHENYQGAPEESRAIWLSDEESRSRLLRGGSWDFNSRNCRSANRYRTDPDLYNCYIGFRIVVPVPGLI